MRGVLGILVHLCVVIFALSGLTALIGAWLKKNSWKNLGLGLMPIIGPISLALCWLVLRAYRAEETLFWSRLMAGDVSKIFAFGSLGLIAGSGLALGALALGEKLGKVMVGAVGLTLIWIVVCLHPTPHYVPIPEWVDKTIWFVLLVGGAGICWLVFQRFRSYLLWAELPLLMGAGILALLSIGVIFAKVQASLPLAITTLEPLARIQVLGCLACHTHAGIGYNQPGGGLESAAGRTEDALTAFLQKPDGETAKRLQIRENPTGEMAGVHLTGDQTAALVDAFKKLYTIKPPALTGAGMEKIEAILTEKTCLSCHTLKDQGAPGGGIGGKLENAAELAEATLRAWLMKPTAENAIQLKIREQPLGAMAAFALTEEQAALMTQWLLQQKPPAK